MANMRLTPTPPTSSMQQAETSRSTVNNPTGKDKGKDNLGLPIPVKFEMNITDGPFRTDRLEVAQTPSSTSPAGARTS